MVGNFHMLSPLHFLYHISGVLWESQCEYVTATIPQFIAWLNRKSESDNPLHGFDSDRFWCYADYKYMVELFENHPELLEVNYNVNCIGRIHEYHSFTLKGKRRKTITFD